MVLFSKQQFQVVGHHPCSVLHPWTSSCMKNYISTSLLGLKGGSKYFLLIYIVQILLRREYQRFDELLQTCMIFLRSCLFCGFSAGSSMGTMCFLRWFNGKYRVLSLGFIPGMVGGCGIFIDHPSRRGIDCTIFIALVADLCLKLFQEEEIFNLTLPLELLIFTISSSLLLYCQRKYSSSHSFLWPFPPSTLAKNLEDRKQCPHKETCLLSIQKAGTRYFGYAFALQVVKVIAYNVEKLFNSPISFFKILFDPKQLRLPLFAGAYITLLKGVSCLLVKYRRRDEAWHILPAGIIASLSYLIQPNLSLALIAFSNLSQILCRESTRDLKLPSWPWQELLFILLMGLLFQARAAHPLLFPHYMTYIMDSATAGRTQFAKPSGQTIMNERSHKVAITAKYIPADLLNSTVLVKAKDVYKLVEENLIVRV